LYCGVGTAYSALAISDDIRIGSFCASPLSKEPYYMTAMLTSTIVASYVRRGNVRNILTVDWPFLRAPRPSLANKPAVPCMCAYHVPSLTPLFPCTSVTTQCMDDGAARVSALLAMSMLTQQVSRLHITSLTPVNLATP